MTEVAFKIVIYFCCLLLLLAGIVCILGCLHGSKVSRAWCLRRRGQTRGRRGWLICESHLIDTVRGKNRACVLNCWELFILWIMSSYKSRKKTHICQMSFLDKGLKRKYSKCFCLLFIIEWMNMLLHKAVEWNNVFLGLAAKTFITSGQMTFIQ